MVKASPHLDSFSSDLLKLLKKHGLSVSGTFRVLGDGFEPMQSLISEEVELQPMIFDRMGPFIKFWAEKKPEKSKVHNIKMNTQIMDKDKLLANGVASPITREGFTNRRTWNEHLKANGCVEYGNDLNNHKAPTEVRGDFNCREDLAKATHQIMEKYGH